MDTKYHQLSDGALLDLIQVAVVALDAEGRVTRINAAGCRLVGCDPSEVIGQNWFERFLPAENREETFAAFRSLMRNEPGTALEYFNNSIVRQDGTLRDVAWHNSILRDSQGCPVGTLSSGEDVTEQRRAKSALNQFQRALDQAAIVAITDRRGVINYVNDEFCRISKFSRDELLGQDHRIVNSGHHPPNFFKTLWRVIGKGEVWRGEILNSAKDGTPYWVDTTIVPLLDDSGTPENYLAIRNDITERKAVEAELGNQSALAQVGQMAAVVAHEVRNPLAGIAGAVEIIGRRLPADSSEREVMGGILQRIDDLNLKIEDLLTYARPKPPRFQAVPLVKLVQEALDFLAADPLMEPIQIESSIDEITLAADPMMLRELLTNVVLNAGQALAGKGKVELRGSLNRGEYRLEICDDGPGMTDEVRRRVLEPFFSTRHSGTGLGLAIADQIATSHGGRLEIRSAPGEGTTVTFALPLRAPAKS